MALTDREKDHFRDALGDREVADQILTIIGSGAPGTLTERAKDHLFSALGERTSVPNIIVALETGDATLNDDEVNRLKVLMADTGMGVNLATELEAITDE